MNMIYTLNHLQYQMSWIFILNLTKRVKIKNGVIINGSYNKQRSKEFSLNPHQVFSENDNTKVKKSLRILDKNSDKKIIELVDKMKREKLLTIEKSFAEKKKPKEVSLYDLYRVKQKASKIALDLNCQDFVPKKKKVYKKVT